jgi:hypothetical protein
VWFLEAEPHKHPVIIKSWIGISGPLEIIGAFRGARRCRPYGRSDLRQVASRLFWTSCYVFIYFAIFSFFHGRVSALFLLRRFNSLADPKYMPVRVTQVGFAHVPWHIGWWKSDVQPGSDASLVSFINVVHKHRHPDSAIARLVSVWSKCRGVRALAAPSLGSLAKKYLALA